MIVRRLLKASKYSTQLNNSSNLYVASRQQFLRTSASSYSSYPLISDKFNVENNRQFSTSIVLQKKKGTGNPFVDLFVESVILRYFCS